MGKNRNYDPKDRLDAWLDRALQQCGDADPRSGLEQRILANLATAEAGTKITGRWRWAFALTALTGGIVVAIWIGSGASHVPKRAVANLPPLANAGIVAKASETRRATMPKPHKNNGQMITRAARLKKVEEEPQKVEEEPRLAQFPSPRPLTEQEQMLRRYVTELPREALLVARAQADRQKEVDKLFARESSNTDSDQ